MATITTDPIADMLTRIRNGLAVGKESVSIPHSKVKEALAKLFKDYGFINGYSVDKATRSLEVRLSETGRPSPITALKRVSRPGQRFYVKAGDIPTVLRGRGLVVLSTSKGMMSGHEAKKAGIGGELICKVW